MADLDERIAADRRRGALRVDERVRRDFTPEEHAVFQTSFLRLVDDGLNVWDAALMAEHGVRWQRGDYTDRTAVKVTAAATEPPEPVEPPAQLPERRRGRPPKPQAPDTLPTYKRCIDCGEYLEIRTAFMRDGRGGYRGECRSCYHKRYRSGAVGYRHRYSYRTRRAK